MTFDLGNDEPEITHLVRRVLLDLARHEDELAAREAASVPYWRTHPRSVGEHRAAAAVLRTEADRFPHAS